ncbi:MAG: thymidine phosphorylase [Firmicutes bacterium]|nr:thymidine phosphorylase [Bacillota bacterium]
MNMNEIIIKKRNGGKLTEEEIRYFVAEYTEGNIPDYQASALLMAIYFSKMDEEETFVLTDAMRTSGDVVDLSAISGIKVDKHSTGGVGDKVTLVVGPLAAACGVPIAKMSGRGLGFTGGTVDKLESIPGFKTTLEPEEFHKQVEDIGIALIGQSGHIAPADKKLYALRDVTGTVENLSLISSSIMSKKLAAGSDAIILDVKCGKGAFMESQDRAEELAGMMCKIGNAAGKRTVAVITDMNQPLGRTVGNSLEVFEAYDTLKGQGPSDITELSLHIAGIMIYLGGKAETPEEGAKKAREAMDSGAGLAKFRELISAQGGKLDMFDYHDATNSIPVADLQEEIVADRDGYVSLIDAQLIGLCSQHTGAGRKVKEDSIDPFAGVLLFKKVGDKVEKGEKLATFYSSDKDKLASAIEEAGGRDSGAEGKAFVISQEKPEIPALIKTTIGL